MSPRNLTKKYSALPKQAVPKTRPIRLSPIGKKQVGITPNIQKYADSFKKKGLKGIHLAKAIIEDIAGFEKIEVEPEIAIKQWLQKSAEQILLSRKVLKGKDPSLILGCSDMAQAAVAALRAAGFLATIIRDERHTFVKILLQEEKKWKAYIADPASEEGKIFQEATEAYLRWEKRKKEQGRLAEGNSFAELGLKKYSDFFKYSKFKPGQ